MIQDNERDALCRMFCAFCRRTLLNARTDVLRSKSRSARRELPFSQMPESELRRLAALDMRRAMRERLGIRGQEQG